MPINVGVFYRLLACIGADVIRVSGVDIGQQRLHRLLEYLG